MNYYLQFNSQHNHNTIQDGNNILSAWTLSRRYSLTRKSSREIEVETTIEKEQNGYLGDGKIKL